jgi:hypothetical protein
MRLGSVKVVLREGFPTLSHPSLNADTGGRSEGLRASDPTRRKWGRRWRQRQAT